MTPITPGPWQVASLPRTSEELPVYAIVSPLPKREIIARVYANSPATARLIAAAPALLAAARHALKTLDRLAQAQALRDEMPECCDLYDTDAAKELRAALFLAEEGER